VTGENVRSKKKMEKGRNFYSISDSGENDSKIVVPINQKNQIRDDVKFIIKSIIPSTLMTSTAVVINKQQPNATGLNQSFKTVLKTANDSSFDNVMESKSIMGRSSVTSSDDSVRSNSICDSANLRKVSKDSGFTQFTPSEDEYKVMTSENESGNNNAELADTDDRSKCSFYSSTPLKPINDETNPNKFVEQSPIQVQPYRLNLLTPPQDASFIDSDFESMEQDQYSCLVASKQTPSRCRSARTTVLPPRKKFSDSVLHRFAHKMEEPTKPGLPKSASTSFLKDSYSFLEETLKRTPLTIRKTFQKQSDKHAKVMNFFSSKKKDQKPKNETSDMRCRKALMSDCSSGSSRCPSPMPLLTKENVQAFESCAYEWGENFDYSFVCEPSTSDGEADEEMPVDEKAAHFTISPDSSYEFQAPLIPVFKIDPPPMACDYARDLIYRHKDACRFAEKTETSQYLRRSASDPITNKTLEEETGSCNSSAQSSDAEVDDDDTKETDLTMTSVIQPIANVVHRASIRSLSDTHSVCSHTLFSLCQTSSNPYFLSPPKEKICTLSNVTNDRTFPIVINRVIEGIDDNIIFLSDIVRV
jgi:hypothetical protein